MWLSSDGGDSFQLLVSLEDEKIIKAYTRVYSHAVTFMSDKGSIFFTKAGEEFKPTFAVKRGMATT